MNMRSCLHKSVLTGALVHLKPILEDGSDAEKQEAAKTVWELAFDKENKQAMKVTTEMHHGLAELCGHLSCRLLELWLQ